MTRIVGIDLGAQGAVALLDGDGHLVHVADLPVLVDGPRSRPSVNPALFATIVREWCPDRAYIEFVSSRPTDSHMSAFAFGQAKGVVVATLATLGVGHEFIAVSVWKRMFGIPPGTGQKNTARADAVRRWPAHADRFARVCDDGRAEACLIGLAGLLRSSRLSAESSGPEREVGAQDSGGYRGGYESQHR